MEMAEWHIELQIPENTLEIHMLIDCIVRDGGKKKEMDKVKKLSNSLNR